jgi:hypothetical protein
MRRSSSCFPGMPREASKSATRLPLHLVRGKGCEVMPLPSADSIFSSLCGAISRRVRFANRSARGVRRRAKRRRPRDRRPDPADRPTSPAPRALPVGARWWRRMEWENQTLQRYPQAGLPEQISNKLRSVKKLLVLLASAALRYLGASSPLPDAATGQKDDVRRSPRTPDPGPGACAGRRRSRARRIARQGNGDAVLRLRHRALLPEGCRAGGRAPPHDPDAARRRARRHGRHGGGRMGSVDRRQRLAQGRRPEGRCPLSLCRIGRGAHSRLLGGAGDDALSAGPPALSPVAPTGRSPARPRSCSPSTGAISSTRRARSRKRRGFRSRPRTSPREALPSGGTSVEARCGNRSTRCAPSLATSRRWRGPPDFSPTLLDWLTDWRSVRLPRDQTTASRGGRWNAGFARLTMRLAVDPIDGWGPVHGGGAARWP